jgi:hypothetical protein
LAACGLNAAERFIALVFEFTQNRKPLERTFSDHRYNAARM